jgi:hypothetical protein
MINLPNDWITSGLVDFEYKKYQLLAYLKQVKAHFRDYKLYPFLAELIFHYNNIKMLQQNKRFIRDGFPKTMTGADFEKLKINYKQVLEDDEIMSELEEIMSFAAPKIQEVLEMGRTAYDFAESSITINQVGLTAIYNNEGYAIIKEDSNSDLMIYRYTITIFESSEETYKGVSFNLVEKKQKSSFESYENIKVALAKSYTDLPNPATYSLEYNSILPYEDTVLPIAKRMLVRYVDQAA